LATVRQRDVAGQIRRQLDAEQVAGLVTGEKESKSLTKDFRAMDQSSGSVLVGLPHGGQSARAALAAGPALACVSGHRTTMTSSALTFPCFPTGFEAMHVKEPVDLVRREVSRSSGRRQHEVPEEVDFFVEHAVSELSRGVCI
jgi:hypothetical protein